MYQDIYSNNIQFTSSRSLHIDNSIQAKLDYFWNTNCALLFRLGESAGIQNTTRSDHIMVHCHKMEK